MNMPIDVMISKNFAGKNGLNFPYRIYAPSNYQKKQCSMLLFLHGAGERGCDNTKHISIHTELISRIINSKDLRGNCVILAPQCPEKMQWVNTPWENGSYSFEKTPIREPMACLVELLEYIGLRYNIDKSRIYIAGMSMGGYGTWNMLMIYPNKFAAAIIVCGAADISQAEKIKHIPIRTYHNADDMTVPVEGTRDIVNALTKIGSNIRYEEEDIGGHNAGTGHILNLIY